MDQDYLSALEDLLYEPILQFVKEHTRLFPGVMKTVFSTHGNIWEGLHAFEGCCPERFLIKLNSMLPVLESPVSLNESGTLLQVLAHPMETDLSEVVELDCSWVKSEYGENILRQNHYFLQKRRVLKNLTMMSSGERETLKWVVDEKRLAGQSGSLLSDRNDRHNMQGIWVDEGRKVKSAQSEFWREGLVPLEVNHLTGPSGFRADEINDAAVAFSQTMSSSAPTAYRKIRHST